MIDQLPGSWVEFYLDQEIECRCGHVVVINELHSLHEIKPVAVAKLNEDGDWEAL